MAIGHSNFYYRMERFSKFHFRDIGQDEKIIRVIHRSWFYLFQQFFLILVICLFFISGFVFVPLFFPNFLDGIDQSIVLFAQSFFMLAVWIYCFMVWIDYYFDIWIITSIRIINIEQKGLFSRKASELLFGNIQDVTTVVAGFFPTVINYGDVKIQTAAEDKEFLFRTVSDPYTIKNIIVDLQKKSEGHLGRETKEMMDKKTEQ